jgi:large subunit ribosomal protein L31
MKAEGHPDYVASTMTCACGATYQTRSTKAQLRLGICASCHPFFTGTQKFVDTAGRVEKFRRRFTDNPAAAPKAKAKKRA